MLVLASKFGTVKDVRILAFTIIASDITPKSVRKVPIELSVEKMLAIVLFEETKLDIELFVATELVTVLFVALTAPLLMLVVAKIVPAVNPVLKFNVPELIFVLTAFVIVLFVA